MILRLAHAAKGNALAHKALLLTEGTVLILGKETVNMLPHRRVDDARRDAVDVDPVLDEGKASRLGDRDNGGLGGAVDRHQRLATAAGLRSKIDDLAALAPVLHAFGHFLQHENEALDVHPEDEVIALLGDFAPWRHVEDGGVVDEDVYAAHALLAFGDTGLDLIHLGDIERIGEGSVADLAGQRIGIGEIEVGHADARTLLCIACGNGRTNATRTAGDDGCFTLKTHQTRTFPWESKR